MQSFDSMIERYKKELIDAKRRSIEKEIIETSAMSLSEPVFFDEEEPDVSAVFSKKPEDFGKDEPQEDIAEAVNAVPSYESRENEREMLGLSSPLENAAKLKDALPEEAQAAAEENNFQSKSDIPDDEDAVFEENEPFPESLGALKVQVFMANRAYPVSSANVIITGKENKKVYFDGYTNTNGVVGSILLPAPKKNFSQSPQAKPPYAQYDITVTHPKFQSRKYLGVPVFSGVESIQNIQLLPLGTDETATDVTESEPNELLMKGGENNA